MKITISYVRARIKELNYYYGKEYQGRKDLIFKMIDALAKTVHKVEIKNLRILMYKELNIIKLTRRLGYSLTGSRSEKEVLENMGSTNYEVSFNPLSPSKFI